MRYLYQMNLNEFESSWAKYFDGNQTGSVNSKGSKFIEYRREIFSISNRLKCLFKKYSARMKEIIEKESMQLENINELMKLEIYLLNIVDIYQNDYIFSENIIKIEDIENYIHDINIDTIWTYFHIYLNRKNSDYKTIFSDLLTLNTCRQIEDKKRIYGQ